MKNTHNMENKSFYISGDKRCFLELSWIHWEGALKGQRFWKSFEVAKRFKHLKCLTFEVYTHISCAMQNSQRRQEAASKNSSYQQISLFHGVRVKVIQDIVTSISSCLTFFPQSKLKSTGRPEQLYCTDIFGHMVLDPLRASVTADCSWGSDEHGWAFSFLNRNIQNILPITQTQTSWVL